MDNKKQINDEEVWVAKEATKAINVTLFTKVGRGYLGR